MAHNTIPERWITRQRREWFQLPANLTEWVFFVGLFGTAIGAGLWVR